MMETAECPYCGYENDTTDLLADLGDSNELDWECGSCEKEFEVLVEFEPTFVTSEIIHKECEECGESGRDFYERGRVFPYPKETKTDVLCKECWRKGVAKNLGDTQ